VKGAGIVPAEREVEVREGIAALEELRRVAVIEGEQILRPFVDSDPAFFTALADRLREALHRYSEIERTGIRADADPEEGYPFVQVELTMNASSERACEVLGAFFDECLGDLYPEPPLELEVVLRAA